MTVKLDGILEKLRKEGLVVKASELAPLERLSCGNISMDYITGGGWLRGGIHLLAGPEGVGKSSLVAHSIRAGQRTADATAIVIDLETSWSREWLQAWNLDLEKIHIARGFASLEDAYDALVGSIGYYDFVVLDSLSAIAAEAEASASVKERQYAPGAREANALLRRLVARHNAIQRQVQSGNLKNSIIVIISQVREMIGGAPSGQSYTPVGGHGIRHLAHIWIDCRVKERLKDDDGRVIAFEIALRTLKNKTAPNFRVAFARLVIRPYEGLTPPTFDPYWDLLVWGELTGIIKRSGAWYAVDGNDKLRWQGANGIYRLPQEVVDMLQSRIYPLAIKHD